LRNTPNPAGTSDCGLAEAPQELIGRDKDRAKAARRPDFLHSLKTHALTTDAGLPPSGLELRA